MLRAGMRTPKQLAAELGCAEQTLRNWWRQDQADRGEREDMLSTYRETWPPFFKWQAQGAAFEILSLDVTAGDDVAFAHALLRCGTKEELTKDPDNRLRLTIGLRKEDGHWVVSHEHHSFPAKD